MLYLTFGPALLKALGGEGKVLEDAIAYADVLFLRSIFIWLMNTGGSVLRGMGNMHFPATLMMIGAIFQIPLSGALILGWGGGPELGIKGAAISTIFIATINFVILVIRLNKHDIPIRLHLNAFILERKNFQSILDVALPAALSPLLTVMTILTLTGLAGHFGESSLAGYGIGSRLEFLLVPIVFGIGAALITIVGVNVGAENFIRAKQIAWTGAFFAAFLTGTVGCIVAIWPALWAGLFTDNAAVYEVAESYMQIVCPCYAMQGLGLALYSGGG